MRIGNHVSSEYKLWKATFFILLCDALKFLIHSTVIFLKIPKMRRCWNLSWPRDNQDGSIRLKRLEETKPPHIIQIDTNASNGPLGCTPWLTVIPELYWNPWSLKLRYPNLDSLQIDCWRKPEERRERRRERIGQNIEKTWGLRLVTKTKLANSYTLKVLHF